jgi:glycosyltransferase involved in cell wall biosynthesis
MICQKVRLNDKMKVCIYGLDAYNLLIQEDGSHVGGAEVQQTLLGIELAKRNTEVSFIVFDYGQEESKISDKLEIYKTVPKGYSIRGFSSFFYALSKTWISLKKSNANIYYCRGPSKELCVIAIFCYLYRRKFVFGMANNKDVDNAFRNNATLYERFSFWFCLKLSSCVISQNYEQKILLKANFNINSVQINNMHIIPKSILKTTNNPIVIWVATIKPERKRPEIFLKLAKAIPQVNFKMIGGPGRDVDFYEQIKVSASEIQNLEFVGFVPYHKVDRYFDEATIFVNTSDVEGFPNTFIQAWLRGIPVISLNVDPDEIICKYKLGFHSKTFDQMVEDLKTLIYNKKLRDEFGANARKYAECEFDSEKIIRQYIETFEDLLK